ncbi:transposase, partial [Dolichospermum planctonicum UHCC 0167]|uniref:transposase n=1 Tax=Dolichospermum planctonicum TaxID=136072 RepID=UPI0014436033
MIVFEFKAKGTKQQYQKIDEAIRITQFIRNKCLRFWMDNQNVKYYDLNKYTAVLASDGYYIQFCVDAERNIDINATGQTVGLDVGLNSFYTNSQGDKIDNPRYLRKSEKSLKRLQKKVSRKNKGSNNRKKAI